ncbi:Protein goliath [Eumeta japonica]|uniref:Protein goliath n=1 Tax=Eumeta variegata TaxID=151549 RepID=A0A4C1VWT6_EUMVA|nr:Protein goliath [Eumeta japonica]
MLIEEKTHEVFSGHPLSSVERLSTTCDKELCYNDSENNPNAGKYGEGYIGSATGVAVHVRARSSAADHTGCTWPLLDANAPDRPLPTEPWIALIRRGNCNFEIKVQNAWRANASAVLVYNDRDTVALEKMKLATDVGRFSAVPRARDPVRRRAPARARPRVGGRWLVFSMGLPIPMLLRALRDRESHAAVSLSLRRGNISAVFTYKWKGEEIARLLDNGTRVLVGILRARTYTHINTNINKTSVLFVSISFIVLMVISLAWLVFYYIQRFRHIHAKDRLSKRLCYAAKKALSKIPVKSLKTEDKELQGDGECCAICIEPYKVSETLRSLPCRHDFHKNCIDPWLLEHRTCPMCKMDILKYYGFVKQLVLERTNVSRITILRRHSSADSQFTGSQESILQLEPEETRPRAISPQRGRHLLTLVCAPLANVRPHQFVEFAF